MSTPENSEATSKIRTFLLKAYFHFITTTYKHNQITYQKQAIITHILTLRKQNQHKIISLLKRKYTLIYLTYILIGNYINHKLRTYSLIQSILHQRTLSAIKLQSLYKAHVIRSHYHRLSKTIKHSYQLYYPHSNTITPQHTTIIECKQYIEAFDLSKTKLHVVSYCPLRKTYVLDIPKSTYNKHSSHKIIRFCFYINNTPIISNAYFSICIDGKVINQYDFCDIDTKLKERKKEFTLFKRNYYPRKYSLTPTISLMDELQVCHEILLKQNLRKKTSMDSFSFKSFEMLQLGSDNEDDFDCPIIQAASKMLLPQIHEETLSKTSTAQSNKDIIRDNNVLYKEHCMYKQIEIKKRLTYNNISFENCILKSILKERNDIRKRNINKTKKERKVKFGTVEFAV